MKRFLLIAGVLAVLVAAGWTFQLIRSWRVHARTARLNEDAINLFDALQKYKEHVGAYPVGGNAEIVKALQGKNARNVIILVGRKSDISAKGEMVDPWGTPLRIYFSDNGILVRSAGPNRRFDDSTVLECDDFFRSN